MSDSAMIHSSKIGGMIASVSGILAIAMMVVTDRSTYFVVIDEDFPLCFYKRRRTLSCRS